MTSYRREKEKKGLVTYCLLRIGKVKMRTTARQARVMRFYVARNSEERGRERGKRHEFVSSYPSLCPRRSMNFLIVSYLKGRFTDDTRIFFFFFYKEKALFEKHGVYLSLSLSLIFTASYILSSQEKKRKKNHPIHFFFPSS